MTVCVAAICNTGTVLGASDRMLTAGDVQFEPTQSKIWLLTTSIVMMVAGDSGIQAEIFNDVYRAVRVRVEAEPTNWWLVKDVAELYGRYYRELSRKRSETRILAPLNLDHNSFIARQAEMSESLVRQIATELLNFSLPPVACLFAGVDTEGTHIYACHNADVECLDTVGFAAIGMGRWHANSQFMFAKHDRSKPFPETLLLTYAAKKRAEVSPGVGEGTDMFSIGPGLGSYVSIYPNIVDELEKMYQATRVREQKASIRANREVNKYVENLTRAATPKEQEVKPKDSAGSPPLDEKVAGDLTNAG